MEVSVSLRPAVALSICLVWYVCPWREREHGVWGCLHGGIAGPDPCRVDCEILFWLHISWNDDDVG